MPKLYAFVVVESLSFVHDRFGLLDFSDGVATNKNG
jgi:hypothetical protein